MKPQKKSKLLEYALIGVLLALFLSQSGYSTLSVYLEGSGIQLEIENGGVMAFGDIDHGITVNVTSGTLNGTSSFTYWRQKGRINVASEGAATYTISAYGNATAVYYHGTLINQINTALVYGSCVNGDALIFGWGVETEPLLPIMFILGMVGFFTFLGGFLFAAYKIREGEWATGLRYGLMFCSLGFGLVWGWLNL